MNASSYDSYISEYIKEVEIIDQNSHIINLKKEDLEMQWRSSIFHKMKNSIILSATFEFPKKNLSNSEFINRKIEKTRNHRSKFQEKAFPNLGSLFATKDLYIDISNSNYFYKFLNIFNKILTKIILKFSNDNSLIIFRKNLVLIYSLIFNIRSEDPFKLSDRTINCLINNGSTSANEAIKTIKKIQQKIGFNKFTSDTNVVKISVVGNAMRNQSGMANIMFKTLAKNQINIHVISTSEIKISVLISSDYYELAMRSLHSAFGLDIWCL